MFRKRKSVSPHYRIPAPFNPVVGSDASLYGPYKPYARFTLSEALTTSDESATATLSTTHQWGPGLYHCPDVIIHVHNFLTKEADVYRFYGSIGDVGIAVWDRDNHWRIVSMTDGSELIGCCLVNNHPGRGNLFEVYLGTWSPDSHEWVYDTESEDTFYAIDWRYGVPYPEAGSTGLFTPRSSTVHGVIYETVSLDCETPGACTSE